MISTPCMSPIKILSWTAEHIWYIHWFQERTGKTSSLLGFSDNASLSVLYKSVFLNHVLRVMLQEWECSEGHSSVPAVKTSHPWSSCQAPLTFVKYHYLTASWLIKVNSPSMLNKSSLRTAWIRSCPASVNEN